MPLAIYHKLHMTGPIASVIWRLLGVAAGGGVAALLLGCSTRVRGPPVPMERT
jgi:hypothetical protein